MRKKKSVLRRSASLTQEEAVESFRSWWDKHWIFLAVATLVAILVLGSWYVWNTHRENRAQQASVLYFELLKKEREYELDSEIEETSLVQDNPARMISPGQTQKNPVTHEEYVAFMNKTLLALDELPETPYSTAARMMRAKYLVKEGQSEGALADLMWVLEEGEQESFKMLALHRLLRIYIDQKQYKKVIDTVIDYEFPEGMNAFLNELLGDAYMGLGKISEARNAYSNALKITQGKKSLLLRLKLQHSGAAGFEQPWEQDQDTP